VTGVRGRRRHRLPRPAPGLLAVALASWPAACSASPAAAPNPPRVVVETADGRRLAVAVELARTEAEQERGLMYRRELAEEAGMLFIFGETAHRSFWMKNTLIPLDMLFFDEAGVLAAIVRDAEPLTLVLRDPGVASRFVLEVRGGWAARHGVAPGARLRLESVSLYQ
jgi:hypothetical protein